jgi:hypothetical protein
MKMKVVDPTLIGHYIRDASTIQKKLSELRGYIDAKK